MEKYGKVLWRNMVRCVPPGNMISPPAANLIARNGEEIRGWSTVSQFIRVPAEWPLYIGTLSLCSATIEGDHWSQGTVFPSRSPHLMSPSEFLFLFSDFFLWAPSLDFFSLGCGFCSCRGKNQFRFSGQCIACRDLCCRPDFAEYEARS